MSEHKIQYKYTPEGNYRYLSIKDFVYEAGEDMICDGEYCDSTLIDMVEGMKVLLGRSEKAEARSKEIESAWQDAELRAEKAEARVRELEAES